MYGIKTRMLIWLNCSFDVHSGSTNHEKDNFAWEIFAVRILFVSKKVNFFLKKKESSKWIHQESKATAKEQTENK